MDKQGRRRTWIVGALVGVVAVGVVAAGIGTLGYLFLRELGESLTAEFSVTVDEPVLEPGAEVTGTVEGVTAGGLAVVLEQQGGARTSHACTLSGHDFSCPTEPGLQSGWLVHATQDEAGDPDAYGDVITTTQAGYDPQVTMARTTEGRTVELELSGFRAGHPVTVWLFDYGRITAKTPRQTVTADASGAARVRFTGVPMGDHPLSVSDGWIDTRRWGAGVGTVKVRSGPQPGQGTVTILDSNGIYN